MSESKDHQQNQVASGAFGFDVRMEARGNWVANVKSAPLGVDPEVVVIQINEAPLYHKMKGGKTFVERAAAQKK